jgi:hypothetical protein
MIQRGNWRSSTDLTLRGGLLNGQRPPSVYYHRWNSQGTTNGSVGYTNTEKYRGTFRVDLNYKSHNFFAGLEYMQEVERSYSINPHGLWSWMRQLTNDQIMQLDYNNPMPLFDNGIFQDTILFYRKYDANDQSEFDIKLRQKLGLPVDGLDFILTDSYDMLNNTINYYDKDGVMQTMSVTADPFSLDMFTFDELFYLVNYMGYDLQGNKLKGKPGPLDYFRNRAIDAYRPSYFSFHLGDRFQWKSLDVSLGLRFDRFNANQPVLKDKYFVVDSSAFEDYQAVNSFLPQINLQYNNPWFNLYLNYNSFTQNPVAFNSFRPDHYDYYAISGFINNPALKPARFDKIAFGAVVPVYRTFYAEAVYLGVFAKDYPYLATRTRGHHVPYQTALNYGKTIEIKTITGTVGYYSPKLSGIAASSSFTQTFMSDENYIDMNIAEWVLNTNITFNFGHGKDFALPNDGLVRKILENFGIGFFHQLRKGLELPEIQFKEMNYTHSPNINIVNLRVEKGFLIKPLNLTASLYLWIENLLHTQNLFYIDPATGKPDDNGFLSAPNSQQWINNQVNPDTYRMLYQFKLMNPDHYDIPRIFRTGLIVNL